MSCPRATGGSPGPCGRSPSPAAGLLETLAVAEPAPHARRTAAWLWPILGLGAGPRRSRPGRLRPRPSGCRPYARDLGARRDGSVRGRRAVAGLGRLPRPPRAVAGRGVHHGRLWVRLHARGWASGEPRPALDGPSVVECHPRRGLLAALPVVLRASLPARAAPRAYGAPRPRRHRRDSRGRRRPLPAEPDPGVRGLGARAAPLVEHGPRRTRVSRLLGGDRRPGGARPAPLLSASPLRCPERKATRPPLRPGSGARSRAVPSRGPGRGPHPSVSASDGLPVGQRVRLPDPLPAAPVHSLRHRPRRRSGPPAGRAATPRAGRPLPAGADDALPVDGDASRRAGRVPVRAAHRAVGGPRLGSRGLAAAEHGRGGIPAPRLARAFDAAARPDVRPFAGRLVAPPAARGTVDSPRPHGPGGGGEPARRAGSGAPDRCGGAAGRRA